MDKLFHSEGDIVIMKKVAILLTSDPSLGGEHQYLMLMLEGLIKCEGLYFELLPICCNRFWRNWCKEHNVKFISCKLEHYSQEEIRRNTYFTYICMIYNMFNDSLYKIICQQKIALLICGQQGIFLPKLPCKIIRPVHDLMHRYEPDFKEISCQYEGRENLFRSVARTADIVLVDSELGKKQFKDCYYNRIHFPKVEVLPFVVPEHIAKGAEEYLEIPDKFVFYPAQFWEHKNHFNLIKAIRLVKKKEKDIALVLVGSEKNSLKKVKKMIEEYGLKENVFIKGFVSDEQITYLYKHAVAMVMPSYFGPTNIPPLEAMALGCPAIVSDKYAMGEQVGEAGLLFNPDSPEEIAECILRVWNDEKLRNEMIVKGYSQISKWSYREFYKKFIRIIRSTLK